VDLGNWVARNCAQGRGLRTGFEEDLKWGIVGGESREDCGCL
jgi:hypothetical protein